MNDALALPLQQHPKFAAALNAIGRQSDQQIGPSGTAVQRINRFGLSFVPRGPIWPSTIPDEQRIADLRHIKPTIINGDSPSPVFHRAGYRQIMTGATVAELSLTGSSGDRIKNAKPKWRNIWRRAQSSEIEIEHTWFNHHQHAWLLDADTAQQRTKGYRALPHAIIYAYAIATPKDVVVFTARRNNTAIAAMLFLHHGHCATYHIGWTNQNGRAYAAHHRLLPHAADWFADRGCLRLDLGTVDTENAPGLARFKIGTGATIRPLAGTWLKIPGL